MNDNYLTLKKIFIVNNTFDDNYLMLEKIFILNENY